MLWENSLSTAMASTASGADYWRPIDVTPPGKIPARGSLHRHLTCQKVYVRFFGKGMHRYTYIYIYTHSYVYIYIHMYTLYIYIHMYTLYIYICHHSF